MTQASQALAVQQVRSLADEPDALVADAFMPVTVRQVHDLLGRLDDLEYLLRQLVQCDRRIADDLLYTINAQQALVDEIVDMVGPATTTSADIQ